MRYLDPDAPTCMAPRMKELRYMRKIEDMDDWGRQRAYSHEAEEKARGKLPVYQGDVEVGFVTPWGWQLQGFIEDRDGALRVQTAEEHRFCMGCHGHIGVTIDQTFSFARKVPGAAGWRPQDLRGLQRPSPARARRPEFVTYFARVGGGDETRSNAELLARFFPDGRRGRAPQGRGRRRLRPRLGPARRLGREPSPSIKRTSPWFASRASFAAATPCWHPQLGCTRGSTRTRTGLTETAATGFWPHPSGWAAAPRLARSAIWRA